MNNLRESNPITVAGITGPTPISITGGEYKIGTGTYTSASGTVNNGDTVTVRQTSSNSVATRTDVTLNIGGVVGTFSVTTGNTSSLFLPVILNAYENYNPPPPVPSTDFRLPKTGQTTFFYPGDDGDLQKGVAWPNPRFQVDGDCILDKLTGLTWAKTPSTTMDWFQALTYANGSSFCGKSGWRLPNVLELESLIQVVKLIPGSWLNSQGFNLGYVHGL